MRCPDCNKFPAFDVAEPEVDIDIEGSTITGTVRLVLTTQCCGAEAKETTFDVELDLKDELSAALRAAGVPEPGDGFDFDNDKVEIAIASEGATADDRYADKDAKGRPIRNVRYRKHFYCVELDVAASCTYPNGDQLATVTAQGSWKGEVQASAMDELV